MNVNRRKEEEKEIVERLFCALRDGGLGSLPWETCRLDASERPDFVTSCGGSSICIEVRVLHVDESGDRPGGSELRKKEAQIWKAAPGNALSPFARGRIY